MNKILFSLPIICLMLFGAGCTYTAPSIPTTTASAQSGVTTSEPTVIPQEIIIFVSKTCPHCAIVESKVKNGQIGKALPISFKEVSDDVNLRLFTEKAQTCKLDFSQLGVPMLWNGSSCYEGDEPIMQYLEKLMKLYEQNPARN